ncbi:MAG: FtsB family cell division protein [Acidobacteriota bacterium]
MVIRILIPRPRRKGFGLKAGKVVWLALGIALWGIAYTLFGAGGMVGVYRAEAEIRDLEQRVREAERTNRALEARIDAVRDDPDEIERLAREELFLVRPGDTVYLLPDDPDDPSARPDAADGAVPDAPLPGLGGDADPPGRH